MEMIGKYAILGAMGQGGMGAIFKARHPTLQETVVVKKLTLQGKEMVERFRREAKIQMSLVHPGIVRVYDHFEDKGHHYIVMEYVDGITLEELIRKKVILGNVAAMVIYRELAKALAYAHRCGVIHRDIKPANVLISKKGEVKFLDFGVASLVGEDDGLTKPGMTIGTLSYLAPEIIENAQKADQRSDIYAASVLLYEMVTGKKPFVGGFSPETLQKVVKGQFAPPRSLNPGLKRVLEKIILKGMHKKAKRRTQRLEKVIDQLNPYLRRFKDQGEINQGIQDYVLGKEDLENKAAGPLWVLVRSGWAWGLLLVGLGLSGGTAYLAFERGLKYELIYPDRFGAFQLEVLAKKGPKDPEVIFRQAMILRQDGDKWQKVDRGPVYLTYRPDLDQPRFYWFQSDKIYLEPGIYRLLVELEQEQFQTTFLLASINEQIKQNNNTDGRILTFKGEEADQSLPAKILLNPVDLASDKELGQPLEMKIFHQGEWVDWTEFQARPEAGELIRSNRDYSFRLEAPAYYPQSLSFHLQPEQTKITLKVPLSAKPVPLLVETDLEGLELRLNNKTSYLEAGKAPKLVPIPTTGSLRTLLLGPGHYYLSLFYPKGWGRTLSTTQEIELQPGQEQRLKVTASPDGQGLQLTNQEIP